MTEIISSQELRSLISGGAQLLDVRSQGEFAQDAIAGAINLPLSELPSSAAKLDNSKPIVVYCRTGGRSARAREVLLQQGFKTVHNAGSLSNLRW